MKRISKKPPTQVKSWIKNWSHSVKSSYFSLSKQDIPSVIQICSVICLADKDKQNDVFWALSCLLMSSKRKKYWGTAAQALPKTSKGLASFADCVFYYEELSAEGHFQSLKKGRINPVTVIETIVKVDDGFRPYLDLYKDSFYTYPAKIFSEQLLVEAGKKLRGRFGDFSLQRDDFVTEFEEAIEHYDA